MEYLLKYVFQEKAQEILDTFTELFGIRIAFFSTEGKELKVGKSKPLCRYCQLLRTRLDYEHTCKWLDQKMRQAAIDAGQTIHYNCHGGMMESITPVIMDENLIGFLMIGQFRTSTKPLDPAINCVWKKQIGTDELQKAFESTPYYSEKDTKYILKLFNILVDYILYRHMIELHGDNSIQPLISFLQMHIEESLDVSQGAKILMQSKSSLVHKFKKATGKSFKKYQIDLKLNRADKYFKEKPQMTIREVAYRLGYEDPYYFSRLYKKYRGRSPLKAKKDFHKKPSV